DGLPSSARLVRLEECLLQPRKLRRTEHYAVRIVGARTGIIGVCSSLHADVAIGATICVDEDYVRAPLLSEVELACAVRSRVRRRINEAALFHRLIVLENLLQSLKAAALVYEGNAAVVWSYIISRVSS